MVHEVIEGRSISIPFYGNGTGWSDGYRFYTVGSSATEGVDFASVDRSGGRLYVVQGKYAYSATVKTLSDDLIEGDEYLTLVQYDLDGGRKFDYDYVDIKIVDNSNKTVYADMNGDGIYDEIEVNAVNIIDKTHELSFDLAEGGISTRLYNQYLDELIENENALKAEIALQIAEVAGGDDLAYKAILRTFFKKMTPSMENYIIKTAKAGKAIENAYDDPTFLNIGDAIITTAALLGPAGDAIATMKGFSDLGLSVLELKFLRDNISAVEDKLSDHLLQMIEKQRALDQIVKIKQEGSSLKSLSGTFDALSSDSDNDSDFSHTIGETTFTVLGDKADHVLDSVELLVGSDSADTINVVEGYDGSTLLLNGGVDTLKFDKERTDFTVSKSDDSVMVFDGSSTLMATEVERLQFEDGTLAFDLDGNAGQAYRIYKAVFDRVPDLEGLGYWIREMDEGKGDRAWVADNFMKSEEFKNTYGTPETVSDDRFLDLLYQNVLDRAPDDEGLAYWKDELDRGFSRDGVISSFSESVENKANVAAQIDDGIWYI